MSIITLIHELHSIENALNLPENEIFSFNPPNFPIGNDDSRVQSKNVWNGNLESSDQNINEPILDDELPGEMGRSSKLKEALDSLHDHSEGLWGSTKATGLEAHAYYKSFHLSKFWGIYISYTGLLKMTSIFNNSFASEGEAIRHVWNGILSHEAMHFGIDVACARLELITRSPIYITAKKGLANTHGYSEDEERIAEGAMLRYFKKNCKKFRSIENKHFDSAYDIAIALSEDGPPGYCEGKLASTMPDFKRYADKYILKLINQSGVGTGNTLPIDLNLSNLIPTVITKGASTPGIVDAVACPVYLVDDLAANNIPNDLLHFISSVSNIRETNRFIKSVTPNYLNDWNLTKLLLGNPSYPKNTVRLDLQRWSDEDSKENGTRAWSVRVGTQSKNMRAHLDEEIDTGIWFADRFGNADKMGHHKQRR